MFLFPAPRIITIWDKIKLLLTPMIEVHTPDGKVYYKVDKKGRIYLFKIEPKKEV